jgi:phage terminase small subunit
MRKLTPKQERFVSEYLIDLNATKAAIRAGYSGNTAQRIGSENLSKPLISAAIQKAKDERSKRTEINQDYVLQGLKREAEREGEDSSHSARVAALTQLGKHLGMFKERIEHSGALVQTHIYLPKKDAAPAGYGATAESVAPETLAACTVALPRKDGKP